MSPKVLLVDDGERHAELLHALLRQYEYATRCELPGPCWTCPHRPGCALTHAHDWAETEQALARHPDLDAVLLDVAFDLPEERLIRQDGEELERARRLQGLAILGRLRRRLGDVPVVLMTSREELELERAAAGVDADEMVTLAGPAAFDARALAMTIERLLALRRRGTEAEGFAWGRSAAMARLREEVNVLATTSLPMLIEGETGTGKSALAEHMIHPASERSGPFLAADLSALPESLLAAELFGAVRGAFSGAVDRPGLFERAHGGTLLLDEIGNLPLDVQRMLLLVLQNRRVTRLGDTAERPVDVKLVAATHLDLEEAVRNGTFRADLYARLNPAGRARVPPLRERAGDIEGLFEAFVRRAFTTGPDRALLRRYLERSGAPSDLPVRVEVGAPPEHDDRCVTFVLPAASLDALRAHRWPGNVRELELLAVGAAVHALADAVRLLERNGDNSTMGPTLPLSAKRIQRSLERSWIDGQGSQEGAGDSLGLTVRPGGDLRETFRDLERQVFERLFQQSDGDFRAMARRLLRGSPEKQARRVRLRFNQLGLRARRRSSE